MPKVYPIRHYYLHGLLNHKLPIYAKPSNEWRHIRLRHNVKYHQLTMHHLGYQTCVKSTWLHHICQKLPDVICDVRHPEGKRHISPTESTRKWHIVVTSRVYWISYNILLGPANGLLPDGTKPLSDPSSFKQNKLQSVNSLLTGQVCN